MPDEQGLTSAFDGANLMVDLGAYWQNRAIASGTRGNITPNTETGIFAGNSLEVQVMAASSATGSNSGGLPSNPNLYSTVGVPSALQSIVTLNITSTATLGLPSVVLNAMANVSAQNTPIFGPPKANLGAQHQDSCSGWLGCAAQTWNSLAGDVVSGFAIVAAFLWSATIASVVFWANLVVAAASLYYEYVIQPTISTIERVGSVIVSALNALLNYIVSLVKAALAAVIDPIVNAAKSFDSNLGAAANATVADVNAGGSVTTAHAIAWASTFDGIALVGVGLGSVVAIAITLTAPFDLGAGFLLSLIVGLVPAIAMQFISGFPFGMATLTQQAVSALETSLGTPLSKNAWTAVAETVGIVAPTSDFFFAMVRSSENSFPESAALAMFTTMIVDLIVMALSFVAWVLHDAVLIITAVVLAAFALGLAAYDWKMYGKLPGLGTFADVSVLLGGIGAGGAGADLALYVG